MLSRVLCPEFCDLKIDPILSFLFLSTYKLEYQNAPVGVFCQNT